MRASTLLLTGLLVAGLTITPAAAGALEAPPLPQPTGPAGPSGPGVPSAETRTLPEQARAEDALERALDLFRGEQVRQRGGLASEHAHGREATLVLRDLAVTAEDLPPEDRRTARRILARPTDGAGPGIEPKYDLATGEEPQRDCAVNVCFHWVETGDHAPNLTDSNENGTPDWVENNVKPVFGQVYRKTVNGLGYRRPLRDGGSEGTVGNPDDKLDIFLADLGSDRLYGYCTTDEEYPDRRTPAYCVIDNDFAKAQYGAPPLKSLKATAAHEFFHAVQFAYDVWEDTWFMESTAAWIEDQVFDGVNDNRRYLSMSPLRYPNAPLDYPGVDNTDLVFRYGSWIYWQFLTEYLGGRGERPIVVRQAWQKAVGPRHSLAAVRAMLADRNRNFGNVFADFGAVNRIAKRWYSEGRTYPQAPVAGTFRLTARNPGTGPLWTSMDHLANTHAKLRAGRTLKGKWRLRINVDLPNKARGSRATVLVHRKGGGIRKVSVRLNRRGDGRVVVPFRRSTVAYVALTMTNASIRSKCNVGTIWSCSGRPRDDGLRYTFRARAIR